MVFKCEDCGIPIHYSGKIGEEYKKTTTREFGKVLCGKCAKKEFLNKESIKRDIKRIKEEGKKFGYTEEQMNKMMKLDE